MRPDNLASLLSQHVGSGDLLIDLAWNIDAGEIMHWCHDHNVLYINTSVELWNPYEDAGSIPPVDRTLYVRHMALRHMMRTWAELGPTAVVEHGANPGLVSHWVKVALEDLTHALLPTLTRSKKRESLENGLADHNYAWLSMLLGVKVIHISERDTQISNRPKAVNEFVNTWSIPRLHEEGVEPAEMGWGTHEKRLPNVPGSEVTGTRGGIHNSVTRCTVKPTHMIGGYAQQAYGFNYYGTIGTNRDEFVIVRKMKNVDWMDQPAAAGSEA